MRLPRLLSESPPHSRSIDTDSIANAMDVMLMKRMNFIRNSLDTHDSLDETARSRDVASRKKEERIMELWQKDV